MFENVSEFPKAWAFRVNGELYFAVDADCCTNRFLILASYGSGAFEYDWHNRVCYSLAYTSNHINKFRKYLSDSDAKALRDELWKREEIKKWKADSTKNKQKGFRRRYPNKKDKEAPTADSAHAHTDEMSLFRCQRLPRERRAGSQGRPSLKLGPFEKLERHRESCREAQRKWYRQNKEAVLENQRKRRQRAKAELAKQQAED